MPNSHCCRHIELGGLSNLRDLGGLTTADGKCRTRTHRLYRSDHLGKVDITVDNINLLCETLNIGYSVDFRSDMERQREPYHIEAVKTTVLAIEPGDVLKIATFADDLTEATCVDCMKRLYALLVTDYKCKYTEFFRLLVNKSSGGDKAVLFHCTAGKDRTGVGAALVLLSLGIPLETVFEDYLLTNQYFKPPSMQNFAMHHGGRQMDEGAMNALFFVRREYLQTALDTIHSVASDVRTYVIEQLGISEEDLKMLSDHLLEQLS